MRLTGWIGLMTLSLVLGPAVGGEKGKLDPAKVLGTWTFVSGEKEGKKIPEKELEKGTVEITKDMLTLAFPQGKFVMKYSIDADKTPAHIKLEILKGPQGEGSKTEGIIALKDGQLQLCYPAKGGTAPKTFATKEGSDLHLFTLKKK